MLHVESGWMSTSFEMISISFASSSPTRFDRTARMMGVIPLTVTDMSGEDVDILGIGIPGNNDDGNVVAFAPLIELLEARI